MKELLKSLGLLSILAGVVVLSIAVFFEIQTNTKLAVSLILIIIGLIGHIILNKYIE